jgi:uncharacterized membrane protein
MTEPASVDAAASVTEHDHSGCAACRSLDAVDGVQDETFAATIGSARTESKARHTFRQAENRSADRITAFAGSMTFVYIHVVWFAAWIAVNVGLAGIGWEFDKFPFGLLTMIVSLEAIFLATFVMISQNRSAAHAEMRADLDFENNVRGEVWSVHIGHQLGIDTDHVESIVQKAIKEAQVRLQPD